MGDAGSLFLGFMLAAIGIRPRFDGPTVRGDPGAGSGRPHLRRAGRRMGLEGRPDAALGTHPTYTKSIW